MSVSDFLILLVIGALAFHFTMKLILLPIDTRLRELDRELLLATVQYALCCIDGDIDIRKCDKAIEEHKKKISNIQGAKVLIFPSSPSSTLLN